MLGHVRLRLQIRLGISVLDYSIHTPEFSYVNPMVKCWDLEVYVSKSPISDIIHALGYISYSHLNLIMQI